MKRASIRLQQGLWQKMHEAVLAHGRDESVAFVTATYLETDEKLVFIPQTMVPAKESDYLRQGPLHLQVSPLYVSRVLNVAEDQSNTAIMVHSHPFDEGVPHYSPTDDYGEAQTSETISKCLNGNPPVGSFLFGQRHATARAWRSKKPIGAATSIIGTESFTLIRSGGNRSKKVSLETVDRQVRAPGRFVPICS